MHLDALEFARRMLEHLPTPSNVLEIGSRNINGSVRDLVHQTGQYIGIDVRAGPGVDVIADGTWFRLNIQPDLAICMEVLEHTPYGRSIIHNVGSQLSSSGHLLITCATDPRQPHSAVDGGPLRNHEYYRNVPEDELCRWIINAGLQSRIIEIYDQRGDLYMLASKT